MATITCIAADDEAPALAIIEQYISRMPELQLVKQFKSATAVNEWLKENTVDIMFLDIQMPRLSGLEVLKQLKKPPLTIFTTAYSEFAADAFDLDAIDYLRKPFSFERFSHAVDKAKEYINMKDKQEQENRSEADATDKYITIKSSGVIVKLFTKDILYLEAFHEYIKIFTATKRYVIYERMKNMEKILPADLFVRVHRSYIVNTGHVTSLSGNMICINEQEIPISRDIRKEDLIRKAF